MSKNIKHKRKINVTGAGNLFDETLLKEKNIKLKIEGSKNEISIHPSCTLNNFSINLVGDNNKIIIDYDVCIAKWTDFLLGAEDLNRINNAIIKIGARTAIGSLLVVAMEPKTEIDIGEDCLFSEGIGLWASDSHAITDLEGSLLNYGGKIKIGNNVWLGRDVKLTKKAEISNDSVVGISSIVTSKFKEPNVVIAGNPAKIIKHGVNWNKYSPHGYLQSLGFPDNL